MPGTRRWPPWKASILARAESSNSAFGALAAEEAAQVIATSLRSVQRQWDLARSSLFRGRRGQMGELDRSWSNRTGARLPAEWRLAISSACSSKRPCVRLTPEWSAIRKVSARYVPTSPVAVSFRVASELAQLGDHNRAW
jgi:hypothetical protein